MSDMRQIKNFTLAIFEDDTAILAIGNDVEEDTTNQEKYDSNYQMDEELENKIK